MSLDCGSAAGVVLAAGSGTRLGADGNKAYVPLAGRRVLSWSLSAFAKLEEVDRLILVIREEDQRLAQAVVEREVPDRAVEIVVGGSTRHASEHRALTHLKAAIVAADIDAVLIHDAARPLMSMTLARLVLAAAREVGGAIPAIPDDGLVTVDESGNVVPSEGKSHFVRAQTPQAFSALQLLSAYEAANADGFEGSDTSACVERYSDLAIRCVPGDLRNFKITYPQDLFMAERLLAAANYKLDAG